MMEKGTSPARKIRVGLLGAGKMALHHAKAIHMREDARLVAVADPAISSRECFMEIEQDVEICSGAEELFDHIKPDVVHICTPPETHVPLARLALQRGSHVYVEKPFAPSKREAVELIALAKDNGFPRVPNITRYNCTICGIWFNLAILRHFACTMICYSISIMFLICRVISIPNNLCAHK